MGLQSINNYALYDDKWIKDDSVSSVGTVAAVPGSTWVSLSWTPPQGGFKGSEAGYVVCRSINTGTNKPPKALAGPGINIVYVGTGTHFGDDLLSENTGDLLTADMGLLPNQSYWYSVFVVTTIPPQKSVSFPDYTRGKFSVPLSIAVMTTGAAVTNILTNPTFAGAITTTSLPGWSVANVGTGTTPGGEGCGQLEFIPATGEDTSNLEVLNPNITGYLRLTSPPSGNIASKCSGTICSDWLVCEDCTWALANCGSKSCTSTGSSATLMIYQTIKPPEGKLIPGKLYSVSLWYRTNNPISPKSALNGNNQVYCPAITVWGNTKPTTQGAAKDPDNYLGFFQMEQSINNEAPLGTIDKPGTPCACTDSTNCIRTLALGGGSISSVYSNFSGLWQRVAMSFIIGSPLPSSVVNAYNGGDVIQAPYPDPTKPLTDLFDSFTVSLEILASSVGAVDAGYIDIAVTTDPNNFDVNPQVVEGILPYTDPSLTIKLNDNLIANPYFDGNYTETLGSVSPHWIYSATTVIDSPSAVCGDPCTGPCIGGNADSGGTCTGVCSGGAGTCTAPSGTCSGATTLCTDGDGLCDTCVGDCTGGADGTCTGKCQGVGKYGCTGTCPSISCTGTCMGTCSADQTCKTQTGTCTGKCAGGTGGSCAGGTVCFKDITKYNGQPIPDFCSQDPTFYGNTTSYIVLTNCCQDTTLMQGNIFGVYEAYKGSYSFETSQSYNFTFEYMLLPAGSAVPSSLTVNIEDLSKFPVDNSHGFGTVKLLPSTEAQYNAGQFNSATVQFTTWDIPINPNISITVAKTGSNPDEWGYVAIRNVQILATGNETYGIQNPFPTIATVPFTTTTTINNSILWRFPAKDPSKTVANQIYNDTAQLADGTQLGWSQGLVLLNDYHYENCTDTPPGEVNSNGDTLIAGVDLGTDPDALVISGSSNVLVMTKSNALPDDPVAGTFGAFENGGSFPMSNAYYGSGQWDIWVKLAKVVKTDGKTIYPAGTNPTGSNFSWWTFHALDYSVAGGPKWLVDSNPLRNTEIDIEIGGACPDYSSNYSFNTARLNGWGGQWGGDGGNFTMHTQMPATPATPFASVGSPNGANLDDGQYHKLSILLNSGVDPTPGLLDPNGVYPTTRTPGFIKWFVDDIEWGCGWTGNIYGMDNIPMTAMRIVIGPWNSDWAGGCLCANIPGNGDCLKGNPVGNGNACAPCLPCAPSTMPCPTCNTWTTATYYVAQMQFTPICLDNPNHVRAPARPDSTKGTYIGASNRNRYLPETKSFMTFPTTNWQ